VDFARKCSRSARRPRIAFHHSAKSPDKREKGLTPSGISATRGAPRHLLPMQKKSTCQSAFFNPRTLIVLLLCSAAACSILIPTRSGLAFLRPQGASNASQRTLTFQERVAYQRAIEDVYWRHRIWPKDRPDAKAPLESVMAQAQLEKKVTDYLRNSQALEDYWRRPVSVEQLQAEMDRMAQHTKQPDVLRELFEALGNDPLVIAECLARSVLTGRLVADLSEQDKARRFESASTKGLRGASMATTNAAYTLPTISTGDPACTDDTWTATSLINAPEARSYHTAVWTGSEMIVWGGDNNNIRLNTGSSYDPSTDSWTATSTTNAPAGRAFHTAVWTGIEMIVWGGFGNGATFNTGGKYNPGTDSWTATSTTNAPTARGSHTAVWTGSEMVVWGGDDANLVALNTGGRYNPNTDSWTATSTTNPPDARLVHTAVWTGNEMIIWGGRDENSVFFNTGGRYDPSSNSWMPTSTTNAPDARATHTAVWTGAEMVVWAGINDIGDDLNTGGRYNPGTDSWVATAVVNAPSARDSHEVVWTNSEMIVWGGTHLGNNLNTGGRYNPGTDSWTATSTVNAPTARYVHTAVWTDSEMIVWGGFNGSDLNTGGRYCGQSGPPPPPTPTPTPTATSTPTPTATPSATSTPSTTPRVIPTPRPRPTPLPRPTPP
jgi:N-acetylneuraminic acid mutarotase